MYKDLIKIIILILPIKIIYNIVLRIIYYSTTTIGINIPDFPYIILQIGLIDLIYYIIYKKIFNIKSVKLLVIALLIITIISGYIMYNNVNISTNNNQQEQTNNIEDNLVKCSNKGYFISQLQGEIYDRESTITTINITNCRAYNQGNSISVSCDYTRTWNNTYETTGTTTRKKVDKLSASNTYKCKG